jgi:hypothetical protein
MDASIDGNKDLAAYRALYRQTIISERKSRVLELEAFVL